MRSRFASALCLAAGLFFGVGAALAQGYDPDRMASPPSQGDQKAREACTPDVMRLCNDYIPDVQQIVACLKRERANLSPACGEIFAAEDPPQQKTKTAKKKGEKKTQVAEKPPEKKKSQKAGAPLSLSATAKQ